MHHFAQIKTCKYCEINFLKFIKISSRDFNTKLSKGTGMLHQNWQITIHYTVLVFNQTCDNKQNQKLYLILRPHWVNALLSNILRIMLNYMYLQTTQQMNISSVLNSCDRAAKYLARIYISFSLFSLEKKWHFIQTTSHSLETI